MFSVSHEISWNELQDQIRHVPLLQQRDGETIYPYLEADIRLREVSYDQVRPSSLYLVKANLELQAQLAADLAPEFDPLNLTGGVTVQDEHGHEIGLIPPIVEETATDGAYLLDGMHRTSLGKQAGRTAFTAVHIQGIRQDCPASVIPNQWTEMITYDAVPTDPALKRHYRPDQMAYRRDFSALNGSKPRT